MMSRILLAALILFPAFASSSRQSIDLGPRIVPAAAGIRVATQAAVPSLDDVVHRLSRYAAAYGAEASMFVGRESYLQRVEAVGLQPSSSKRLLSEFAIVKAGSDADWIGYRDVVRVDERAVTNRRDRLLALLTAEAVDASQLKRIADESARYNLGPVSRNFNVPTTALFFFLPATIDRFVFERKGTKEIDGVLTWELEFHEKGRPTLVRTAEGRDAPSSGRVWVMPGDGTLVRSRLELRDFANREKPLAQSAGGTGPGSPDGSLRIESVAMVEVVYRLDARFGVWLPSKMTETYEGAVESRTGVPLPSRSSGTAEYSDFRRFATSAKIVGVK